MARPRGVHLPPGAVHRPYQAVHEAGHVPGAHSLDARLGVVGAVAVEGLLGALEVHFQQQRPVVGADVAQLLLVVARHEGGHRTAAVALKGTIRGIDGCFS